MLRSWQLGFQNRTAWQCCVSEQDATGSVKQVVPNRNTCCFCHKLIQANENVDFKGLWTGTWVFLQIHFFGLRLKQKVSAHTDKILKIISSTSNSKSNMSDDVRPCQSSRWRYQVPKNGTLPEMNQAITTTVSHVLTDNEAEWLPSITLEVFSWKSSTWRLFQKLHWHWPIINYLVGLLWACSSLRNMWLIGKNTPPVTMGRTNKP